MADVENPEESEKHNHRYQKPEKGKVGPDDIVIFNHKTDEISLESLKFLNAPTESAKRNKDYVEKWLETTGKPLVQSGQREGEFEVTPSEERSCCKKCCGCYPLGDQPKLDDQILTDEEIEDAMNKNLSGMLRDEQDAILLYSDMRACYQGPYSDFYEEAIEEDEHFRTVFSLSQMTSRVWTNNFCTDLWLFSLQKHPMLGFASHHTHPLELADRTLIFLTGFCICLINQIAPLCEREVCTDTCFHLFLRNGICEDGGNFTWAGSDSAYIFNTHHPGSGDQLGADDFFDYQINGPFACDYGTDCFDCGPRDKMELRRAAVTKTFNYLDGGHPDGAGFWCFHNNQVYVKTVAMTFCIIPVSFTVITNLLLCKCCLTQDDVKTKVFWTDFGQNLGNSIVMMLITFAGYLTKEYIDRDLNFLVLLANKAFVFALIGGINVAVFIMSYKAAKQKIYRFKGMRNYIRANYTLNGKLDDLESLDDIKAARKDIANEVLFAAYGGTNTIKRKLDTDKEADAKEAEAAAAAADK